MYILIFQHIECEGLGSAAQILSEANLELRYIHLYKGQSPPADWQNAAGLIFLGGPMNVYQEQQYPFLKVENEIIKEAIRQDKPTLGICLGAQLIAKAAGAKVYPGEQKEIGWYPLYLTPQAHEQGLDFTSPLIVFQWHGDTFDLPARAIPLASSDLFPHQAFRLGKNIYALQFHLEVTLPMIKEWFDVYKEETSCFFSPQQHEEIHQASCRQINTLQQHAQNFFQQFVKLLREHTKNTTVKLAQE